MSTARDIALIRLDSRNLPEWRPNRIARKLVERVGQASDPRDRALAEQIETGVIKDLLLLQHLAEVYADRPLPKIHPILQKILAVAIYQLRFLDRVPPSAAVDQGVEQAKRFGMKHAAGFANAVLRKAATDRANPLPELAPEILYSHPADFIERLAGIVGTEQAIAICQHNNAEPPTTLRLMGSHTMEEVIQAGGACRPHQDSGILVLDRVEKSLLASLAENGIAQVQDPTSVKVILAADILPGHTVLDRCCGLGTKTLQAWEKTGPTAAIAAIDPSEARCDGLRQMLAARRITNVRVIQSAEVPAGIPEIPQHYDRVLVDAPCSNSGVLARRPEARYAQSDKSLLQLRDLQRRIVADTLNHVSHDGLLIYSTCSIWPQENEQMIQWMLNAHPGFELLSEQTTLPSCTTDPIAYHDGGYYAILKRNK